MNYVKTVFICAVMVASAPALAPVFATAASSTNVNVLTDQNTHHGAAARAPTIELIGAIKAVTQTGFAHDQKPLEMGDVNISKLNSDKPSSASTRNARSFAATNTAATNRGKINRVATNTVTTKLVATNNDEQGAPEINNKATESHSIEDITAIRNSSIIEPLTHQTEKNDSTHTRTESEIEAPPPMINAMAFHAVSTNTKVPSDSGSHSQSEVDNSTLNHSSIPNASVPEIDGAQSGLAIGLIISLLAALRERRSHKISY